MCSCGLKGISSCQQRQMMRIQARARIVNGVRVPTSTGDGPLVDLHRPLVTETAAVREIHYRPAEFLVARPAEHGLFVFSGLPSRG